MMSYDTVQLLSILCKELQYNREKSVFEDWKGIELTDTEAMYPLLEVADREAMLPSGC